MVLQVPNPYQLVYKFNCHERAVHVNMAKVYHQDPNTSTNLGLPQGSHVPLISSTSQARTEAPALALSILPYAPFPLSTP